MTFGNGYTYLANRALEVARDAMLAIGDAAASTSFAVGEKTQDVSDRVGLALIKFTWQTNHPAIGLTRLTFKPIKGQRATNLL